MDLTASFGIEKVREPARVVMVSVRPHDISFISRPERPRFSSMCAWLMMGLLPSTCNWISSLLDHCAALSA